jgi:adenosylcobinamide-GDP ribazoletransferase
MKKEATIFLTAIMFLTRLPVPKKIDHSALYLQKSPKYFPFIGSIVAALSVIPFVVLHKFIAADIAIIGMMITSILTTGCFHEDGFADTCDAFGGGWTKEKILAIMKDSRLGTYGVAGLVLMLATKFLLLKQLITSLSFTQNKEMQLYVLFIAIVMAAHSNSRLMSVLVIQGQQYVTADDGSKSKPLASKKLNVAALLIAIFFALVPCIVLPLACLIALPAMLIATYLMASYFNKWIGGYTGDCLGAVQQVTEIVFYFSILIVWKFI